MRAGLWCRVGGAQGVLGWWCGQVVVSLCSSPIPLVSLWLRVPPKGQGYPVGMPRSQNVSTGDPVHVEYVFLVSDLVFNNIW